MRHPDYEGRSLSCCCEREPTDKPDDTAYVCTLRAGHHGDHEASIPDGTVLVRWPKHTEM
jgi:hypothetical protein